MSVISSPLLIMTVKLFNDFLSRGCDGLIIDIFVSAGVAVSNFPQTSPRIITVFDEIESFLIPK